MKWILLLFVTFWITFSSYAQIPQTISFQGVLTDSLDMPKPDGIYLLTFRLYTAPTGGAPIWSEQNSVNVTKGLFTHNLGSINSFFPSLTFDKPYWLTIEVSGESELTPRIILSSSPYSFSALRADTATVSLISIGDTLWQTNGSDVYRLNGNLGLGTVPTSFKLDVNGSARVSNLLISNNAASGRIFVSNTNGQGNWSDDIRIVGNNVGIGTVTPKAALHVTADSSGFNPSFTRTAVFENSGNVTLSLRTANANDLSLLFERAVGDTGLRISSIQGGDMRIGRYRFTDNGSASSSFYLFLDVETGNFGIKRNPLSNDLEVDGSASKTTAGDWLANSDLRIKTDISEIDNSKEMLLKLHPVKFRYSNEWRELNPSIENKFYYNFIAQEYREVFPGSVKGSGEYLNGDSEEILQIDPYNAQIVAIKAVQELIEENNNLKNEIDELRSELNILKKEIEDINPYTIREAKR